MGLLTKKPPPGPVPTLSVYLNTSADKIFKPNDTVSGHVTFSTPISINPQALEVSFWGMSSVWWRTSKSSNNSKKYTHYRDNAPLFNISVNVLEGYLQAPELGGGMVMGKEKGGEKETGTGVKEVELGGMSQQPQQPLTRNTDLLHPGRTYTFPFSFLVPEGTGFHRPGFYKNDFDESWTIHPHHLPPSVLFGQKKEWPDNAFVEYGVTARLLCPGITDPVKSTKKYQEPISSTAEILFSPLNPHLHQPFSVVRFTKPFTLASSALTGQDAKSIGFRQSMKDRFSKETPTLEFEAAVEVPDYLTSGAEFRFRASFTALKKSGNVVTVPAITFTVLKLELLDFTFIRAPRDFDASSQMSGWHLNGTPTSLPQAPPTVPNDVYEKDVYRERKTHLNSISSNTTLTLEELPVVGEKDKKEIEQAKSCAMWFSARVPGFTPPSFKSFAITRCYRIRVRMGIEIGGKKFEHDVEGVVNALGSAP